MLLRALRAAALTAGVVLLILTAAWSVRWRLEHDTALLHYAAFLMDAEGRVPYRDIFETSMPGTFAFHYAIVALLGPGDLAFHLVDLALLAVLLGCTYRFMQRFGAGSAIAACVFFGLAYLSKGQTMTLQRDYVGCVAIAIALACIPPAATLPGAFRFGLAGMMFGLAALIKPQLAIGLPVVVWALLKSGRQIAQRQRRMVARNTLIASAAFLAPLLVAMLYLWVRSALADFFWMTVHYLPLHNALTGSHVNLLGTDWWHYVAIETARLGGYWPLFVCAVAGLARFFGGAHARRMEAQRIGAAVIGAGVAAYLIYPTLAAKFWDYHYMPMAYFLALASGLALVDAAPAGRQAIAKVVTLSAAPAILLAGAWLQLEPVRLGSAALAGLRRDYVAPSPMRGRVDELAEWIRHNVQPDDRIQTLDWNGGAIHAMLLTRSHLATSFMYDYHFYHHGSSAVNRILRDRFLTQLVRSTPRFFISIEASKPWPSGADTHVAFPELSRFISAKYEPVSGGEGYTIYRLRKP